MSTQTIPYREILDRLPADSTLTLRNVSWQEYETLLESLSDASGIRVSYDQGTLQIVTLSSEVDLEAPVRVPEESAISLESSTKASNGKP